MIEIRARERFLDVKIMIINENPIEISVPWITFVKRDASYGM